MTRARRFRAMGGMSTDRPSVLPFPPSLVAINATEERIGVIVDLLRRDPDLLDAIEYLLRRRELPDNVRA